MNKKKKIIAILQPGFLPWLGFFEQMEVADIFVYLDDVQYTKQDWRNRNYIKANGAKTLLTVPVGKVPSDTMLRDVNISKDPKWANKHINLIQNAYRKSAFFGEVFDGLKSIYQKPTDDLVSFDLELTEYLCQHMGVSTPISFASNAPKTTDDKNLRLIEICKFFDADVFYDGKAAKDFIDIGLFKKSGIDVIFQDYQHPEYTQLGDKFIPYMSALDLVFNEGPSSLDIILSSPRPSILVRDQMDAA
tara:strand:- start:406 stop:1146 length:741 start_codon:yes stop_codon:yes gene_type:complete